MESPRSLDKINLNDYVTTRDATGSSGVMYLMSAYGYAYAYAECMQFYDDLFSVFILVPDDCSYG